MSTRTHVAHVAPPDASTWGARAACIAVQGHLHGTGTHGTWYAVRCVVAASGVRAVPVLVFMSAPSRIRLCAVVSASVAPVSPLGSGWAIAPAIRTGWGHADSSSYQDWLGGVSIAPAIRSYREDLSR